MQWLKLQTDILDDDKINIIRAMAEGDSLFVLWIGLLCLGMKKETKYLYVSDGVAYNAKMLARQLRMDESVVSLGLQTFEKLNMISIDGAIAITNFEKYQSISTIQRTRDLTAARMRKYRKKLSHESVTRNAVTVTPTEREIDIEKEKKESGKPDISALTKEIISFLNERAGTSYRATTKATKNFIHARLNEGWDVEDFKKAVRYCVYEWGDPPRDGQKDMRPFIRPQTIFGTKMEAYVQGFNRVKAEQEHQERKSAER